MSGKHKHPVKILLQRWFGALTMIAGRYGCLVVNFCPTQSINQNQSGSKVTSIMTLLQIHSRWHPLTMTNDSLLFCVYSGCCGSSHKMHLFYITYNAKGTQEQYMDTDTIHLNNIFMLHIMHYTLTGDTQKLCGFLWSRFLSNFQLQRDNFALFLDARKTRLNFRRQLTHEILRFSRLKKQREDEY